jgi:hypothetical protein
MCALKSEIMLEPCTPHESMLLIKGKVKEKQRRKKAKIGWKEAKCNSIVYVSSSLASILALQMLRDKSVHVRQIEQGENSHSTQASPSSSSTSPSPTAQQP